MILYYRSKPDQKFIEQQHVAKRHDFIVRGGKTYLKVHYATFLQETKHSS